MVLCVLLSACNEPDMNPSSTEAEIRAAILTTLNAETAAAFERDYDRWTTHWVQEPYVTKTYLQFPDSTCAETVGWEAVSAFVREYIEAHPEPEPLPEPITDITIREYGRGAWVDYEQQYADGSYKRESRLMELVEGEWKIASMWTRVYGL